MYSINSFVYKVSLSKQVYKITILCYALPVHLEFNEHLRVPRRYIRYINKLEHLSPIISFEYLHKLDIINNREFNCHYPFFKLRKLHTETGIKIALQMRKHNKKQSFTFFDILLNAILSAVVKV